MASLHPTIAFALCVLLPLLRASPLPAVTPLARLNARQFTATTTTAPLESMTSTTIDSASSSVSTQERSTWRGAVSARGDQARSESSPMLSAVTIGLICAVIVILIMARLYYVLKYYHLSWRSFFIPPHGLKIGRFRIDPPKPHAPNGPPPAYTRGHRIARQRRGVQVEGADVGEGGVREGGRDEDDTWEGDAGAEPKESLPTYAVDLDLPGYNYRREAQQFGREVVQERRGEEVLPTAQAYEAATRRVQPGRSNSTQAVGGETVEMQEREVMAPETIRRHSTAASTSSTGSNSTASSSATKIEDLEAAQHEREEDKPEEERIEHATGDLGEVEMTSRSTEPDSARRQD